MDSKLSGELSLGRSSETPFSSERTLDFTTGESPLRVFPPKVEFSNSKVGVQTLLRVVVQNIDHARHRIRLIPPTSPCLRVLHEPKAGLAPGLEQSFDVILTANEEKDFGDQLFVLTEAAKLRIPIHVTFAAPKLEVEPFVNFGVVAHQHLATKDVPIRNVGLLEGSFEISCEEKAPVTIAPMSGKIGPGQTTILKVSLAPENVGVVRTRVDVLLNGKRTSSLDVSGTVVKSNVELMHPDGSGALTKIDFGTAYLHQMIVMKGSIVNNSPNPCNFAIREQRAGIGTLMSDVQGSEGDSEHEEEMDEAAEERAQKEVEKCSFSANPSEGRIEPYGTMDIEFGFIAQGTIDKKGFKSKNVDPKDLIEAFRSQMIIDIVETEQKLRVQLMGKALPPQVSLSESKIMFGECDVNDYLDAIVTIKNMSDQLTIDFSVDKVAQFSCRPSSGTLMPFESKNVEVSYMPRQLGTFAKTIMFHFCNGTLKIPLRVSGNSNRIGRKRELTGGPGCLPEDFKRPAKFSQPAKFRVERPISARPRSAATTNSTKDSVVYRIRDAEEEKSRRDFEELVEHRRKYNVCIRQGRSEQQQMIQRSRFEQRYMNETDAGIIPGEGLESPRLDAAEITEAPFVEKGSLSGKMSKGRRAIKFDENRLLKKKFKPTPTTPAEARDCAAVLTPKQLLSVVTGPKVLDFGRQTVFSSTAKSFFVSNDLTSHILVTMGYDREEIKRSKPVSQVIPPGTLAGFDIIVSSDFAQTVQQTVFFTLNNSHRLKFLIYAEIIPIDVQLSREDVHFRFSDYDLDASISETVMMTNTGNSVAKFKFAEDQTQFIIDPLHGSIDPFQSQTVTIRYTPLPGSDLRVEQSLSLEVKGGEARSLRCIASINEARCVVPEKTVEFGTIPVGILKKKTFTIRNVGKNSTVFWVDPASSDVTVTPTKGRVATHASAEVTVSIRATEQQAIDTSLVINIRGGKSIRVPVKAEAEIPRIRIPDGPIDFGEVFLNSSARYPMTFSNDSHIPSILFIDFEEYPEFSVLLPDGKEVPETDEGVICVVRTIDVERGDGEMFVPEDDDDVDDDLADDLTEADTESSLEFDHGKKYKLTIEPSGEISFILMYSPMELGDHDFPLPITLAGMPGSTGRLSRQILASSVRSKVSLSQTVVDFRNKVIVDPAKNVLPHTMEFDLIGEDRMPVQWEWDAQILEDSKDIFRVEPMSGVVHMQEITSVTVQFLPRESQAYAMNLPLYIAGRKEKAYLNVDIKGNGIHPMLTFDQKELLLPLVPLGFPSSLVFHVINEGYDNVDLKYKLPADSERVPLTIRFPEGTILSHTHPQIPVEVVFKAKKGTSFTAKIDFFDNDGNRFSIPVSGTTDNSIMTVYPFISANRESVTYSALDGKPIVLREMTDEESHEQKYTGSSGMSVISGGVSDGGTSVYGQSERLRRKVYSKRNLEDLQRFLNMNVLKNPVEDLLSECVRGNGAIIFEIVGSLSGKDVPGKVQNLSEDRRECVMQLIDQYDALLAFLKSHGALLNEVRPEFFLTYDDYVRVLAIREEKQLASGLPLPTQQQRKITEKRYIYRAMEAWMSLFYQVLKCFMLNRITMKSLRSLPGIPKDVAQPDTTMAGSNVYSLSENVLLKWLSFHYNSYFGLIDTSAEEMEVLGHTSSKTLLGGGFGGKSGRRSSVADLTKPVRFKDFDATLRDSRAFAAVLCSHVPMAEKKLTGLITACTSIEHLEKNAQLLISALKSVGLEYIPEAASIVRPNPRHMTLFVYYLYQFLPQFVPKATIEFDCELLVPRQKSIQLSNPTKRPIEYDVRIETDGVFTVDAEKVSIEPRVEKSLIVTATSRFTKSSEGRLTLLPRRMGIFTPNAMVFLLKTKVKSEKSHETIEISSQMYQPKTIDVLVKSPFDEAAKYQVIVSQSYEGGTGGAPSSGLTAGGSISSGGGGGSGAHPRMTHQRTSSTLVTYPDAFWTKVEWLPIRRGEGAKLSLQFLPLRLGKHVCRLLFVDEKVGEFVYTLVGHGTLPEVSAKFTCQCETNQRIEREHPVPQRNALLDRAMDVVQQRFKEMHLRRKATPIIPVDKPIRYRVDCESPYFVAPKEIVFNTSAPPPDQGPPSSRQGRRPDVMESLPVTFTPDQPGMYPTTIVLRSPYDIRVVELEGKALSAGVSGAIEFTVEAGRNVQQELPVTNSTDEDWTVQATLTGDPSFVGGKELRVPRQQTRSFVLTFSPKWICDATGELVLFNQATGEKYMYRLHGVAEEPLALDHLVAECRARQVLKFPVEIPDIAGGGTKFTVECDLPFTTVPSEIDIGEGNCILEIMTPKGGIFHGSLTFVGTNGHYKWYTIELHVDQANSEGNIELEAHIREAVIVDISVSNPLDETIQFLVDIKGRGLSGDPVLVLGPLETGSYELLYQPLVTGSEKGRIAFDNDEIGEFWYELTLNGLPPEDIHVPKMECEVGSSVAETVSIENPIDEEVTLKADSSNWSNFSVSPKTFVLGSLESQDIEISYTPSSIGEDQRGEIVFSNPRVGSWTFKCVGVGTKPSLMDEIEVIAQIGRTNTQVASFRNPFPVPRHFNVTLEIDPAEEEESEAAGGMFDLLLRPPRLTLKPFTVAQIPFSFSAKSMSEHHAQLLVTQTGADEAMTWTFPIRGSAECIPTDMPFQLRTVARERLEKTIDVVLPQLDSLEDEDTFSHEVIYPDEHASILSRALTIAPVNATIPTMDAPLQFDVHFVPLRPLRATVELVIYRNRGGQWRFELELESTPAAVDDVIVIESSMKKTESVTFRLTNIFATVAPFKTFFTPESSLEFIVSPTVGKLAPLGSEGTQFLISYTANHYGKTDVGVLVIETEEMEWRYEVRGCLPEYQPPRDVATRIETHLTTTLEDRLTRPTRRNFLRENLKSKLTKKPVKWQ